MRSRKHARAFQNEFKGGIYTFKLPVNRSSGHYSHNFILKLNRNKGGNKWHNIKRSPLDVSQVKTEVEGLRNSEHRLSKVGIAT